VTSLFRALFMTSPFAAISFTSNWTDTSPNVPLGGFLLTTSDAMLLLKLKGKKH